MEQRPLGETGLEISAIAFGAGAVGGAVFRGDVEQRIETVRRARAAGINWIDTAPGYGDGQSEENLGRILGQIEWRPHLSTKVRLRVEDLAEIPAAAQRSLHESLGRLRQGSVDLVQLHNRVLRRRDEATGALGIEDVLGRGGVADAFDQLRTDGLARFAGFTALGDVDVLHELVASGRFHTIQAYHNLLNPSMTQRVPPAFSAEDYRGLARVASERGMAVLNIRVLAAGALAGQPPRGGFAMSPGSEPERDAARARRIDEALRGEPGTPAQRAIRFALARPAISAVLVGFSNPEQVDEAAAAVSLPPPRPAALERLEALYANDFEGA